MVDRDSPPTYFWVHDARLCAVAPPGHMSRETDVSAEDLAPLSKAFENLVI